MTRSHRKYHSVIWSLLAAFLPLCFIIAIFVRPNKPLQSEDRSNTISAMIETDTDSTYIVTVNVGYIEEASCVAILSTSPGEMVLGIINRQGPHKFVIPAVALPVTLNLRDVIHQKSISSIQLFKQDKE